MNQKKLKSVKVATATKATPESKMIAVVWAMSDQLHADGNPLNPTKIMGTDYGYTSDSMQGFLGGIHGRLAWHDPKYRFDFDTAFGDAAIALTVGELTNKINDKATLA